MNSPQTTKLSKQLDKRLAGQDSLSAYRGPMREGLRISLPTDNSFSSSHFSNENDLRNTLNRKKRNAPHTCFTPKNTLDSFPPSTTTTTTTANNSFHHNQRYPSTRPHPFPITSTSTSTPVKRKRELNLPFDNDDDGDTKDEIQCFDDEIVPRAQPKPKPLRSSRTERVGSPEKIIVNSEDDTEEMKRNARLKTKQFEYKTFRTPDANGSIRPNRNGLFEGSHSRNVDNTDSSKEEKLKNIHDRLGRKEARPSADTIFGNTIRRHHIERRKSHSTINDTASHSYGPRPKTAHGRSINSDAEGECEFDTIRPARTSITGVRIIDRMQCKDGNQPRPPNKPSRGIHIQDLTDFSDIVGPNNTGPPRTAKQSTSLRRRTNEFSNSQFGAPISIHSIDETSSLPSAHLNGGTPSSRRISEGRDFGTITLEIKKLFHNRILNEAINTGKIKLVFTPSAEFRIMQRDTDLFKMEASQVHAFNWYDIAKVTSEPLIVISTALRDRRDNDKGIKDSQKTKCYMVPASSGTEMTNFLKAVKENFESSNRKIPFSVLTDEQVVELPEINQIVGLKKITSNRSNSERRALERDTQSSGSGMLTRSKRRSVAPQHNIDVALFSYPFGERGSVTITNSDLGRLNDQEFLNDNLIEWYLKYIQNGLQEKNPELAKSIHFFNSFFYKRLTEKERKGGIAYELVKKWTNKVDLFDKQYIVIPINESLHWYLALIYNPGYLLKPLDWDNQKEGSPEIIASESDGSNSGTPVSTKIPPSLDIKNPMISNILETDGIEGTGEAYCIGDSEVKSIASDSPDIAKDKEGFTEPAVVVDDALGEAIDVVETGLDKRDEDAEVIVDETTRESEPPEVKRSKGASKGKSKGSKEKRVRPLEKTWIVIFDSLSNKNNNTVRKNLKDYLIAEAKDKKNADITEVTKERLRMIFAKVPGQSNSCDCGVYLLHYVETFLSDPQTYLDIIVNHEDDKTAWLYTKVKRRREKMRELVGKLAEEYEEWQTEKAKELSLQET